MKIEGLNVDVEALGKGIYELFDETEQSMIAMGMLPGVKMESLEKMLGQKFEESAKDQAKKFGFNTDYDVADQEKKKSFVRKATHEISVQIYKHADSIGRMIV